MKSCPECGKPILVVVRLDAYQGGKVMKAKVQERWKRASHEQRSRVGRELAEAREERRIEVAKPLKGLERPEHAPNCPCPVCRPPEAA